MQLDSRAPSAHLGAAAPRPMALGHGKESQVPGGSSPGARTQASPPDPLGSMHLTPQAHRSVLSPVQPREARRPQFSSGLPACTGTIHLNQPRNAGSSGKARNPHPGCAELRRPVCRNRRSALESAQRELGGATWWRDVCRAGSLPAQSPGCWWTSEPAPRQVQNRHNWTGVKSVTPKSMPTKDLRMESSLFHLEPQNVTKLGNRVFADGVK